MSMREFTEGSYRMQSPDFFQTKRSAKNDFLEIYDIFNVTKYGPIWAAKCDYTKE